jgi:hypothetical protein
MVKRSLFCLMMMAGAALILSGCGQKGTAAKGIASEPGPLGKYKEPVTVSWGISTSSVQMFRPGDN